MVRGQRWIDQKVQRARFTDLGLHRGRHHPTITSSPHWRCLAPQGRVANSTRSLDASLQPRLKSNSRRQRVQKSAEVRFCLRGRWLRRISSVATPCCALQLATNGWRSRRRAEGLSFGLRRKHSAEKSWHSSERVVGRTGGSTFRAMWKSNAATLENCPEKGGLDVAISTTQQPTDQRSDWRPTSF